MENQTKKIKPIVTSRLLFISALDKIYLVILGLTLLSLTIINFSGRISSPYYNFWGRVGIEVIILIGLFILYLFLNWFYKCAVKTVLCLTEKQVYKEKYIPFKRTETSIPLNRITKVSTHTAFWIFRVIIIHQYHQFPMFFFPWNHQIGMRRSLYIPHTLQAALHVYLAQPEHRRRGQGYRQHP